MAPPPAACGSSPCSRPCSERALSGLLVVTAVAAERDALVAGLGDAAFDVVRIGPYEARRRGGLTVLAGGVGPAASASAAATAFALAPYALAVSAGIGGGFAGRAEVGELVEATTIVAADLGADSPEGFLSVDALGFSSAEIAAAELGIAGARRGPVFTVSTVTGSEHRAAELAARGGIGEAMEGFGVAEAARRFGIPVGEVRAISNAVGVRQRESWDIPGALAALGGVAPRLATLAAELDP